MWECDNVLFLTSHTVGVVRDPPQHVMQPNSNSPRSHFHILPHFLPTFALELKRITASLLLLVFAYSIVGLHLLGGFVLTGMKKMWHERLMGEEMVKLEFDETEKINWVYEHEVLLNGVMYDVEKTETIAGKTILHAYADHEEVQTLKTLAGLNRESGKKEGLWSGVWLFDFALCDNNFFQGLYSLNNDFSFENIKDLPSSFLKKDSPPPERG